MTQVVVVEQRTTTTTAATVLVVVKSRPNDLTIIEREAVSEVIDMVVVNANVWMVAIVNAWAMNDTAPMIEMDAVVNDKVEVVTIEWAMAMAMVTIEWAVAMAMVTIEWAMAMVAMTDT